jgi:hypothetical protein
MADTADKIQAAAKAVANKIGDVPRDLEEDYRIQKGIEDAKDIARGHLDDGDKAGNSVEAAGKAIKNRVENAGRELKAEYNKEKAKEALD